MEYELLLSTAKALYQQTEPGGIFEAEDETVKLAYLRRARLREAANRDNLRDE